MDQRYEAASQSGVRKIEDNNAKYPDEKLPYIVVVHDELADLMLIAPAKVEMADHAPGAARGGATGNPPGRGNAAPMVDSGFTGLIKRAFRSRIAFAVSSRSISRVILDIGRRRARSLGPRGHALSSIDAPKPVRAQGAW